ncbi:MAG TPA: hypothetical protein VGG75_14755 [Trebonia sp.]|jgi:hypothetical protein
MGAEVEAHVEFGLDGRPAGHIIHARQSGLSWFIWEVLETWRMPMQQRPYGPGPPVEVDRYRLRVGGPLPGPAAPHRPYGNFVMVARRYSDDSLTWWISPE